jgi:hypothetical protein
MRTRELHSLMKRFFQHDSLMLSSQIPSFFSHGEIVFNVTSHWQTREICSSNLIQRDIQYSNYTTCVVVLKRFWPAPSSITRTPFSVVVRDAWIFFFKIYNHLDLVV